ncbi:phage baseplate protein [Serratia aquatilis]|uniref:Phage baseplate protein n=1 Tax=Serratia aquatilis TaxID=1737515 RepID=A0ABV6EFA0_9GAMM
MAITGLFTRNRPKIGNLYFDATLRETSELHTDVSEFPLETAETAHDNAVTRPLSLTMTIGVSDNWYRELMAQQEDSLAGLLGVGANITTGIAASILGGRGAMLAGIGASIATNFYSGGQSTSSRSQNLLEQLRELQRSHTPFELVSSRGSTYKNCLITNTRTENSKETEGGMEIVVDLLQLTIIHDTVAETNANLPYGDTAATQAQKEVSHGEVVVQEVKGESYPLGRPHHPPSI